MSYGQETRLNLSVDQLVEAALERGEAQRCANGAIVALTGKRTGRSPKDRFIVDDAITHDDVDWGAVNQPISAEKFDQLWDKAVNHLADKTVYVAQLRVGQDEKLGLSVTVHTEFAWHNLFTRHMFVRPDVWAPAEGRDWEILNAATCVLDPEIDGMPDDGCVILNFTQRKVLLCGMRYAGEMKKAMFTALNFKLPTEDVLPMHCAANAGQSGDVALFFGLSGTGKTTLSSDPQRFLIGDDEHGWSREGVFNFEGGCYAKCIGLSPEREPVIWSAIKGGSIMENVYINPETHEPDYTDDRYTKNSRAAYPRENIPQRVDHNSGGHPSAVIFLTCDLYGVLPAVSQLSREQAAYYFLSGYTAMVGSTEVGGGSGIKPAFSTCFGAPFFPRDPSVYAELLMKRLDEVGCKVFLVNTGWAGGGYGQGGERFSIRTTRQVVHSILDGHVEAAEKSLVPGFGFEVPISLPGLDPVLLDPSKQWDNQDAYQANVRALIDQFVDNFKQFDHVSEAVKASGPIAK